MTEAESVDAVADARRDAMRDVESWTAFRLANEADCSSPDDNESAGATFLRSVRDATVELLENADVDDITGDRLDDDGAIHEIADNAPDVYTSTRWAEFVDLGAFQEDVSEYVGPEMTDMEQLAGVALYIIAERLARRIVETVADAIREAEDGDDDGELVTAINEEVRKYAAERFGIES